MEMEWPNLLLLEQSETTGDGSLLSHFFKDLPPPSFILDFTMDALSLGYTLPTNGLVRDCHPLDCTHGRTNKDGTR
ncbi:MAG: hypothetical protein KGZ63_05890 [Clostridiales bacterium]|nr:hypothetical protein [Clostridiales bacterium]